ncbi:MAG TPA: SRPBCC family protein [Candidatus Thermoplasmatota archaeon]|nr:SRPBCC family protein [Candidatus Thermoplasmatota archaeon]
MNTTQQTQVSKTGTTLRLQRVLKAPPERVYQAFLDPDALAKWIPPNGFTGHVHHLDARVGGTFRMSFSTINRSWTQYFGGRYLELRPHERIVHTDKFEGDVPGFPSDHEMKVTITFARVAGGTEVTIVQENLPPGPASEGAPEGWKQSIENLARLVEAELPF